MTLTSRTLGLALAAALTVSGSGLVAGAAHAHEQSRTPDRSYGTVVTLNKAKLKACKTPIRQGRAFRVYAFLDHTAGARRDEVSAAMTVTKRGEATPEGFETGPIKGGKKSELYDLVVPRRGAFGLEVLIEGRQSGAGAGLTADSLRRC